jgi:hypothetical protein
VAERERRGLDGAEHQRRIQRVMADSSSRRLRTSDADSCGGDIAQIATSEVDRELAVNAAQIHQQMATVK